MSRVLRLSPQGSGALDDWGPMPTEDLVAGIGQQHGHLWLDDAGLGLMVGVWKCSPMTGRMGPWSTNEFVLLIDGAVTIDHEDGSALHLTAGEAAYIPKGTVCSWRQEGELMKYFVIHSDASGLTAADPAKLRARKIDPGAALVPAEGPGAELLIGDAPSCREAVAFTDLTGQLTTGVWSATPYQRKPIAFPRHELMHIVEGEVTIGDEAFRAGDTLFVAMGAVAGWRSGSDVRKVFCSFTPGA
ncbi:MAG: cupin domain-containing protein [Hyphomicrobium sp.]|uniref:cupin domain-containing protein n=1 Tax=Hyphomicrobium sp. TaxID=82 RepID=UPI003D1206BC